LGSVERELSAETVSSLHSSAFRDLPKKEQGIQLYEALLPGQLRGAFLQHQAQARQEGKLLRLMIRLSQEVGAIDWPVEFLHDARTGENLALAAGVTIARESPQ